MRIRVHIYLAFAGLSLSGATGVLAADRPAPEYFLQTVMAATTAQQIALACPSISVNFPVVSKASGDLIERLEADGFDTNSDSLGMHDTSAEFEQRQAAFLSQYNLHDGADTNDVCHAAKAEMTANTEIGAYLMEVIQ